MSSAIGVLSSALKESDSRDDYTMFVGAFSRLVTCDLGPETFI